MQDKSKFLIIVIQSVIIAFLLIYLVFSFEDQERISRLEQKIIELEDSASAWTQRNDSLSLLLQEFRITNAVLPFLDKRQVDYLVKKGLDNPVEDLRNALRSDPDLINISAVLGGTMGFYFSDGIHILNKRWVFAYFEDGHIAGAMLLRYDIDQNGRISWEVIDEIIF